MSSETRLKRETKQNEKKKGWRVKYSYYRERPSTLKLTKLEVNFPALYSALTSLEPYFLVLYGDGVWIQPRLYMGLRRGGSAYLKSWLKENKEISDRLSHIATAVLYCVAAYNRFTTYDEIIDYLQDRGLRTEIVAEPSRERALTRDQLEKEKIQLDNLIASYQIGIRGLETLFKETSKNVKEGNPAKYDLAQLEKQLDEQRTKLEETILKRRSLDEKSFTLKA